MGSSIEKLFKGSVITKRIGAIGEGLTLTPERGHAWIVLSGYVVHITGTETMLVTARDGRTNQIFFIIPTGIASMVVPLFAVSIQTGGAQCQWSPHIITDNDRLTFSGDGSSFVNLEMLDFVMV